MVISWNRRSTPFYPLPHFTPPPAPAPAPPYPPPPMVSTSALSLSSLPKVRTEIYPYLLFFSFFLNCVYTLVFLLSQISFAFQNNHTTQLWTLSTSSLRHNAPDSLCPFTLLTINYRPLSSRRLLITAAATGGPTSRRGSTSRRVYQESIAQPSIAPVKQIASFILPAGAFIVVTFGMHFARYDRFCFFFSDLGIFGNENVA